MKNELKKYNCLILEDEPLATEILEMYVEKDSELSLVGSCSNAVNALEILKSTPVDLLFLDLHLPIIKGFDFLRKLANPPSVIVTTAYHEYAIEGFDLDVVDYLLKPIPYERFIKAVEKFKYLSKTNEAFLELSNQEYIKVIHNRKTIKILLNEIYFIESFREYLVIHTTSEDYKIKMPLSKMENLLDTTRFKRVHKSFIVALDKVNLWTATFLQIQDFKIPLGRSFKTEY